MPLFARIQRCGTRKFRAPVPLNKLTIILIAEKFTNLWILTSFWREEPLALQFKTQAQLSRAVYSHSSPLCLCARALTMAYRSNSSLQQRQQLAANYCQVNDVLDTLKIEVSCV